MGRSEEIKLEPNDSIDLTLLQAEFENFYDKTKRFIASDKKNGYINFLRLEYNEIAASSQIYSSEWQRIGIAKIERINTNDTLQHLDIELPIPLENTGNPHSKFKTAIRKCLRDNIKTNFKSKDSKSLMDTRTSIIYLMKCKMKGCKRDLYIGRTHVGKIRRHKQHTAIDTCSAVYQHIDHDEDEGHGFLIEDMKILEKCCDGNKLKILESLYIKEYLLNERILEGKDGILNKRIEKALSIFGYNSDDEECARQYLNRPNNDGEAGGIMEGGGQDTYELCHCNSDNDSSEYDEE